MRRVQLSVLCRGVVQGVGFRPAVHRLAAALGLSGTITNVAGAVELRLAGPREQLEELLEQLPAALPAAARLEPLQPQWLVEAGEGPLVEGLTIAAGVAQPLGVGLIAPALAADQAPCPSCLAELADPANRRHRYPFISCSLCGPRYTIATAEPFARSHTTLATFPLCCACQAEFEDPGNRRFHAETIGCPACGPRLALLINASMQPRLTSASLVGQSAAEAEALIERAAALLQAGGILALQGVGGFQLLVDATNARAVERLRQRKRRPAKPFALLVSGAEAIEPLCALSPAERAVLKDPAAAIVLLQRRPEARQALPGVAPGSPALGVMLPASPLHLLLAEASGRPLVATSGNHSGEPLCHEPEEALERLAGIAEAWLLHNRPIARPLEDSVLHVIDGRPSLLRRARGYAPTSIAIAGSNAAAALALGGDLKNAPALQLQGRAWLAPQLGDLAEPRVAERLRLGLAELLERYGPQLEALACDGHPGYVSHQLAQRLAPALPPRAVARPLPHHLAHGLAVVAEHGLELPVLAFGFDGLGYGHDAPGLEQPQEQLRGSELLWIARCNADGPADSGLIVRRLAALQPFPLPGGERAMREPRRVALGLLQAAAALEHPGAHYSRGGFERSERELLQQAIANGINAPACSAMGRLFDGVASLLGLCQRLSYEGEGGLRLEAAAAEALAGASGIGAAYPLPLVPAAGMALGRLDWQPLLEALLSDIAAGTPVAEGAARFHNGVVQAVASSAARAATVTGCRQVVLAGGCFQNRRLLEGAIRALRRRGLEPHWGQQVPSNDGGLALGQLLAVGYANVSPPHGGLMADGQSG